MNGGGGFKPSNALTIPTLLLPKHTRTDRQFSERLKLIY